ncbi:NlpC/P60 family protein [Brachybacterium sp. ACRRE]|uniref:C40 family peptidase n=1 Tax=Brachybacterium sp. ACRRE TaxID=2918184 RepID=UPI001EF1B0C0|nr:NlpC/P60 family protein [Brachybacterium sp. ACRRE]MCG7310439.1 NlpC/P60 family protein [Brachybacterium sp. ACRRE]
MAQKNTHRAAGRAVTPISASSAAVRTASGAAVLGTVLVGSAFTMQGATAQTAPAAPAQNTASASTAKATVTTAASAKSSSLSAGATLFSGVRGERVSALQASLNDHGAHLAVDGVFGTKTNAAVRDFQSTNGLRVDGRVGPETRGALNGGSSSSVSSSSSSTSGSSIVAAARSQIGVHYNWGSSNPSRGLDCSGLTTYAYSQAGKSLPRTSSGQAAGGTRISQSQAQPGDIVHWPGHVGIYAGNNKVIDASGSRQQVIERTIWGSPTFISYR